MGALDLVRLSCYRRSAEIPFTFSTIYRLSAMPLKLPFFPGIFVIVLGTIVSAQGDNSLWTSWIPIAVRSPYLSIWMNATHVPLNTSNVNGVLRAPTVWPQSLQNQVRNLLRTAVNAVQISA